MRGVLFQKLSYDEQIFENNTAKRLSALGHRRNVRTQPMDKVQERFQQSALGAFNVSNTIL